MKVFTERSTRCDASPTATASIPRSFQRFNQNQPSLVIGRFERFIFAQYARGCDASESIRRTLSSGAVLPHLAPGETVFFSHFFCATHARKIASAHYDLSRSVYPSSHHGVARLTFALIRRATGAFQLHVALRNISHPPPRLFLRSAPPAR